MYFGLYHVFLTHYYSKQIKSHQISATRLAIFIMNVRRCVYSNNEIFITPDRVVTNCNEML